MSTDATQKQVVDTPQSYFSVLKIKVPNSTKWDPAMAEQLLIGLFSIEGTVRLEIGASAGEIEWAIVAPTNYQESTINYIYSFYPNATITAQAKVNTAVGYHLYTLHTAAPFVAPLQHASDFSSFDPISAILNALNQVKEDEQIIYELILMPPGYDYYKLGQKLISQSLVKWWHFFSLEGAAFAAASKSMGTDKIGKYAPEIQKMAQAKLNATLKEVLFCIKVKTSSQERADNLVALLEPGLASFERPGFNFLVPPQDGSFSLLLSAQEIASLWHLPNEQCKNSGIVWGSSATSALPSAVAHQKEGVRIGTNVYQGETRDVYLPFADRTTHVNIIGKTRVGKSTLMHHIIHQDIAAGRGVGVIDPHGHLIDTILATSIPPEREKDVVLFDISDQEFPIGLNMLSATDGLSVGVVSSQTLAIIRKMFADNWSSSRMEDALYAALVAALSTEDATIQTVPKLFLDSGFRAQALQSVTDPVALEFWYEEYEPLTAPHQREYARPITNRLRKFYRNDAVRPIVCQKNSLDFRAIIDEGKIFLAKLGGIADIDSETLGALLISKFQLAAMSRGSQSPEDLAEFYLHVDEVQNFVTTSLDKMFSEAGKYGLRLVVANQYLKQLEGNTLEAVMGNTGTSIIFRVGPQDSRALAPFVKPAHTSDDLVNLDRFTTVVKMQLRGETMPAFSMGTIPPLPLSKNAGAQQKAIRMQSRARYARPREEVEAELLARFQEQQRRPVAEDSGEAGYFG